MSAGHFEQDVVAGNLNGIPFQLDPWVEVVLSGSAIELPGMPRADDHLAVKRPVGTEVGPKKGTDAFSPQQDS